MGSTSAAATNQNELFIKHTKYASEDASVGGGRMLPRRGTTSVGESLEVE